MRASVRAPTVCGAVLALLICGCGSSAHPTTANPSGGAGPASVTFRVPSSAMLPALKIGQTIHVVSYNGARPVIGDIVVFHPPHGADLGNGVCAAAKQGLGHVEACDAPTRTPSSQIFIKRVVAGPGDRISIVDGRVIRNGVREQASILDCGGGSICNFRKTIVVPPGHYFLLGDNRGASEDSRFWGPVPRSWVLGRVVPG
jgi:signal peptidase I